MTEKFRHVVEAHAIEQLNGILAKIEAMPPMLPPDTTSSLTDEGHKAWMEQSRQLNTLLDDARLKCVYACAQPVLDVYKKVVKAWSDRTPPQDE